MNINDPRIRNQVRQAHKVAKSGKLTAAAQLYNDILAENPDIAEAWAGLGNVLADEQERENAYLHALKLDPQNKLAKKGLAQMRGEPIPAAPQTPAQQKTAAVQPADWTETDTVHNRFDQVQEAAETNTETETEPLPTVCYRHPETETSLRCNRCNKPICIKCANRTSVGYRCPDCIREIESSYYTAENRDYITASLVAYPLGITIGVLVIFLAARIGFGFLIYFILFAVSGAIGSFIGRVTHRAIGRRRGRYIPHIVGSAVALGAIIPGLIILLAGGGFFGLLAPAIYAFAATSAAYYQLR